MTQEWLFSPVTENAAELSPRAANGYKSSSLSTRTLELPVCAQKSGHSCIVSRAAEPPLASHIAAERRPAEARLEAIHSYLSPLHVPNVDSAPYLHQRFNVTYPRWHPSA